MKREAALGAMSICAISIGLVAAAVPASAAETRKAVPSERTTLAPAARPVVYVPPADGAPGRRVGGGTRDERMDSCRAEIVALVPDTHVGLTTRAQPALPWFLSEDVGCRIDFVLNAPGRDQPLVEKTLEGPFRAGVQRVELSRFDVKLEPNVAYEWSVSIVRDPERRARDAVAGGSILRRGSDSERTPAPDDAARYANEGLWYDALDALWQQLAADPDDAELHAQRAGLLEQVGLGEAASQDRSERP